MAGEEAAQGSEGYTVGRLDRRPLHLASEHSRFMAKGEKLDPLVVVSTSHDDHQLGQKADGGVYLASPEGSRDGS